MSASNLNYNYTLPEVEILIAYFESKYNYAQSAVEAGYKFVMSEKDRFTHNNMTYVIHQRRRKQFAKIVNVLRGIKEDCIESRAKIFLDAYKYRD